MMLSRRTLMLSAAATVALPLPAFAADGPRWYDAGQGLAASGRDVVAYFSLSSKRADGVLGSADFSTMHKGTTFQFASAENLATFQSNPDKYAPRYGGHCAFAMSRNYFASGDPDAWTIHEGALFLNVSKLIRTRWALNITSNVASGNTNWNGHYPGEV